MAAKSKSKSKPEGKDGANSASKARGKASGKAPGKAGKGARGQAAAVGAWPEAPAAPTEEQRGEARKHLAAAGRNDPCWCGSGKKYKKCHLVADETTAIEPEAAPDPQAVILRGWQLFEQRRPLAAEREFAKALELAPDLPDALVGVGMAKLSTGDTDGARSELGKAIAAGESDAAELRKEGVTNAFEKPESQAYIRAGHALGCLAYDQERYDDSVKDLEKVFSIDEGTVGTEARLVASKAFMKLGKADDAAAVLVPALKSEAGSRRARLSLVLAQFAAGKKSEARKTLDQALVDNPHFGRALLGRLRKQVETMAGAQPGTQEEAAIYQQTYGDVWTDEARAFVEEVLAERDAG